MRWAVLGLIGAAMLIAPLTYCGVRWQDKQWELRADCQRSGGMWTPNAVCMWSKDTPPN